MSGFRTRIKQLPPSGEKDEAPSGKEGEENTTKNAAPPGGDAVCRSAYPGGVPGSQKKKAATGSSDVTGLPTKDFSALRERLERAKRPSLHLRGQ